MHLLRQFIYDFVDSSWYFIFDYFLLPNRNKKDLYSITNNPNDVIPYKYFTNSFNGMQLHKIDILLEKINLYKSTVNYINNDNIIIKRITNKQYLLNNNNPYYKQFIDNYNNELL